MGSFNCSCFYSKDNGQIILSEGNQNIIRPRQISIIPEETFFDIIVNYYSIKKIEIEKITSQEFSELLYYNSEIKKILEEYEDKFDDLTINCYTAIGPVKFINVDENKSEKNNTEFYYEGEYNNEGVINGRGIKIIKNSLIFKGEFLNGEYNGKGLLIKNGGSIYGDWVKGICTGNAIYKVEGKFEYIGNFENNKKNGYGIEKYNDGSQYEGNFLNNLKSGKGIYKFQNGEIYEGNFENDLYNGEGKYFWSNGGRKYEGEFKNGVINGKGIYTYDDGTIFNGYFIDGAKNGEGYLEFQDGKKYYGNWINDELYGKGYLVNDNEKIEIVSRHGKIIASSIDNNLEAGTSTIKLKESLQKQSSATSENYNVDKNSKEENMKNS